MPFEPGKSGNLNGRPRGSPNKITQKQKELIESILSSNAKKFEREFKALKGEKFVNIYIALLEFNLPKLQRTELKGELENYNTSFDNMTFEQLYELKYGRKPNKH